MEVLKTTVSVARTETDLKAIEKEYASAIKTLKALLGNVNFPKENFKGILARKYTIPSIDALSGQMMASHPLLELAMKEKELAENKVKLLKAQRFSDLDFEIAGGRDPFGSRIFEAKLGIPLPIFNSNQAKIKAAEYRIEQKELEIQSVRNELLVKLNETYKNFLNAHERVQSYNEIILPNARKALDQTNVGYKTGKFQYLDVLDSQRTLADARVAYTAALLDLNISAADLEKLTGSKLVVIR